MAFSARLDLDPLKDVRLVDFSYTLNRDFDPTGRPSSGVKGGVINITIESSGKTDMFAWMVDPFQTKSGKIRIMDETTAGSSLKEISFEDTYIVSYNESFHWMGGTNMMESFTISAKKIDVGGNPHLNEWPEK